MRRVVIGNFGAIVGMGIRDLLSGYPCELVGEEPDGALLATCIERVRPDAVVVDVDHGDGDRLASTLSERFPHTVVVAVSSSRPDVVVYPRHEDGQPYEQALDGEVLARALG